MIDHNEVFQSSELSGNIVNANGRTDHWQVVPTIEVGSVGTLHYLIQFNSILKVQFY